MPSSKHVSQSVAIANISDIPLRPSTTQISYFSFPYQEVFCCCPGYMPLIFVCSDSDKMCQTLFTPALVSGHNLVSTHRLENFLSLRVSFYKLIDKLLFPSWWGDNCKFCFYSGITKTSSLKFSHHHIHQLSAVVVISTSQTVPWKDVFKMCLFQNWWHLVREAPLSEKCSFFEHCSKGLWPPPPFIWTFVLFCRGCFLNAFLRI